MLNMYLVERKKEGEGGGERVRERERQTERSLAVISSNPQPTSPICTTD